MEMKQSSQKVSCCSHTRALCFGASRVFIRLHLLRVPLLALTESQHGCCAAVDGGIFGRYGGGLDGVRRRLFHQKVATAKVCFDWRWCVPEWSVPLLSRLSCDGCVSRALYAFVSTVLYKHNSWLAWLVACGFNAALVVAGALLILYISVRALLRR
jgi:hypothetical protein